MQITYIWIAYLFFYASINAKNFFAKNLLNQQKQIRIPKVLLRSPLRGGQEAFFTRNLSTSILRLPRTDSVTSRSYREFTFTYKKGAPNQKKPVLQYNSFKMHHQVFLGNLWGIKKVNETNVHSILNWDFFWVWNIFR